MATETCANCGDKLPRKPVKLKAGGPPFCSDKCQQEFIAERAALAGAPERGSK